jgi:hypothetical protein
MSLLANKQPITVQEWCSRVQSNCRTISGNYLPVRDRSAYEYTCKVSQFVTEQTFVVRFTSPDGSALVPENYPGARAITVAEFAENSGFVQQLLSGWDHSEPISAAQLLVHFCTTCNRRVVIDGAHRLVCMASRGALDSDLQVTELAGAEWPAGMPDMNTICSCE